MGFTKKPCPACGEVHPHRSADDICSYCKRLIKEALDTRKRLKEDSGLVPARLGDAHHWNDTHYHNGRSEDIDETGRAIWRLAKAVTIPDPEHRADWDEGLLGKVNGHEDSYVLVGKETGECLRRLNKSIHVIVENAYKNGFKDGHNLLSRLATGDVTINEFYSRSERGY